MFTGRETLVAGTLRGFRCWNLNIDKDRMIRGAWSYLVNDTSCLTSIATPHRWEGDQELARCDKSLKSLRRFMAHNDGCISPHHHAPMLGCTCGIYGWYELRNALIEHTGMVVGVTENSGRVLLGTMGYRAEKSRIIAVCINTDYLYRCRWTPFNEFNEYSDYKNFTRYVPHILNYLRRDFSVRYSSVKFYTSFNELVIDYPTDIGTIKNLGIKTPPQTPPEKAGHGLSE